jgi:hypothetical protein
LSNVFVNLADSTGPVGDTTLDTTPNASGNYVAVMSVEFFAFDDLRVLAGFKQYPLANFDPYFVRGVGRNSYANNATSLTALLPSWILWPTAAQHLYAFLTDTVPTGASAEDTQVASTDPDLEHPVGLDFAAATCVAQTRNHVYGTNDVVAGKVLDSTTLADAIRAVFVLHTQEVDDAFSDTNVTERVFLWEVAPSNNPIWIDYGDHDVLDRELFYAFGKAHLSGTVRAQVTRGDFGTAPYVSSAVLQGIQTDLYDFDYEIGSLSLLAAPVQSGYPTLGSAGHVTRNAVNLSGEVSGVFAYAF